MAKKQEQDIRDYLVTLEADVASIALGGVVFPVQQGRLSLTAAQAAPLIAEGLIKPVPEKPAAKGDQPALDLLPAEE